MGIPSRGFFLLRILGSKLLIYKTLHKYFGDFRWSCCAAMRVGVLMLKRHREWHLWHLSQKSVHLLSPSVGCSHTSLTIPQLKINLSRHIQLSIQHIWPDFGDLYVPIFMFWLCNYWSIFSRPLVVDLTPFISSLCYLISKECLYVFPPFPGPYSNINFAFFQVVHPTSKGACITRGLLENDGEWINCLDDASVMQTGCQLRSLFVTILTHGNPTFPFELWERFREHICDDLAYALRCKGIVNSTDEQVWDYGLYLMEKSLRQQNSGLEKFPPMPLPQIDWDNQFGNHLILEQRDYDTEEQKQLIFGHLFLLMVNFMLLFHVLHLYIE
jgi:hypothetical protein